MTGNIPPQRNRTALSRSSNALPHDLQSRHLTGAEGAGLDADFKGESIDEIDIARINLVLLAELLKDDKNKSMADVIAGSRGLRYLLECIRSLSREQKFMYQNMSTIERAPEVLKDIPCEED
jgi:hypothetical protein